MATIYVVEDDSDIRKGLIQGLEQEGFEVRWNDNGAKVFNEVRDNQPDLMILDIRLPGLDGLSVCRQLRGHGMVFPILMLTARDEEIDRITGLETGADDYLVKPFSFRELVSRIRAHLRRAYGEYRSPVQETAGSTLDQSLTFGHFTFDLLSLRLYKNEDPPQEIFLTPVEVRALSYFLRNADISLTRQQIIDGVWGPTVYLEDERTVDVHIRHLREKIESDPSQPEFLVTVRGHGYRFDRNPPRVASIKKP